MVYQNRVTVARTSASILIKVWINFLLTIKPRVTPWKKINVSVKTFTQTQHQSSPWLSVKKLIKMKLRCVCIYVYVATIQQRNSDARKWQFLLPELVDHYTSSWVQVAATSSDCDWHQQLSKVLWSSLIQALRHLHVDDDTGFVDNPLRQWQPVRSEIISVYEFYFLL